MQFTTDRGSVPHRNSRASVMRFGGTGTALATSETVPHIRSLGRPDPATDRYLGCLPADRDRPYAHFMQASTSPMQPQAVDAYFDHAVASSSIVPLARLGEDLNRDGYSAVENGYGSVAGTGQVWAAVHTDLPGNTAAMWDWWFGWHSVESARHRLWHPDAHGFAAIKHDLSRTPGLTDRQRYVGNVSYVDEYVGGQLTQLAIRYLDPATAGLHTSEDVTVVYAGVASSEMPLGLGYLAHQIRPTPRGAEMRSRFYLNVPGTHETDQHASAARRRRGDLPAMTDQLPFTVCYARALLEHCAREMNHLGGFLPDLYREQSLPTARR